jgi:uncharacterized protein YukE
MLSKDHANQLRSLLAETGLIEKVRARLYRDWQATGADEYDPRQKQWQAIGEKLQLLELLEQELARIGEVDG